MVDRGDVSTVLKLVILIINFSQISGDNATTSVCPDEVNPFNLVFEVPEERPNGLISVPTDEVPILYWIPRKDLGCDANHRRELFQAMEYKIQPQQTQPLLSSSPPCEQSIKKWLNRVSKVIEHNLILSIRVQSINLVNDNFILRKFAFKNKLISQLTPTELLEAAGKLIQDVNDGFSLPTLMGTLSKDKFGELTENVRILKDIRAAGVALRTVHYECSWCNTCETTILTDCVEDLYEYIIGGHPRRGTKGRKGYADVLEILGEGVRAVRRTFGVKDGFSGLKLPMVPPCFE